MYIRSLLSIAAVYLLVGWQPVFAGGSCSLFALGPSWVTQQIHDSWKRKGGRPLSPDRLIDMATWRTWKVHDYLRYDGKLLAFETPDSLSRDEWPIVEVLSYRMCAGAERKAIDMIFSEFARRPVAVELGVLVINRTDGVSEIHFVDNDRRDAIDGNRAISGLLNTKTPMDSIQSVQFFHNHPSNGPLSKSDIQITKNWSHFFGLDNPYRFPVHMYSVSNFDGERVLFHYGVRYGD